MQVSYDCPKCLESVSSEVTSASRGIMCCECNWMKPIADGDLKEAVPQRCLVCGCEDLWRQKDFPQNLGLAIVAVGIVLSTFFVWNMQPELSLGVLMVFALADMALYGVMRDRLVCYRCHAIYRGMKELKQIGTFDLEVNERYRQESIRLNQAKGSSSSS